MPLPDQSQPGQFLGDFQADGVHNDLSAPSASAGSEGNSTTVSSTEQGANGLNAIAEGKQNAKAVLAASGVSLPSAEAGHSALNGKTSPNSQLSNANGSATSRKRSRDGSVIRTSSTEDLPVRVRETPADRILLEQYVEREFRHSALTAWHNPSQELLQQKRAERDYYLALRRDTHGNPAPYTALDMKDLEMPGLICAISIRSCYTPLIGGDREIERPGSCELRGRT